jgi:DNA-directed RNA polymerase specialized sigma54-like protein
MLNSDTQSENDSMMLSQAETDDLLKSVSEQMVLNTFDVNDRALLKRLVECLGDERA